MAPASPSATPTASPSSSSHHPRPPEPASPRPLVATGAACAAGCRQRSLRAVHEIVNHGESASAAQAHRPLAWNPQDVQPHRLSNDPTTAAAEQKFYLGTDRHPAALTAEA